MDPAQIPIRASTQQHLDIEDIKDSLIILKNGSCCLVLQTNAVNFDLLSETEQDATIYAYAGLLNSLSFPIQIFIRSKQKDISSYLKLLKKQKTITRSNKLNQQIIKYQKFIEKTVQENKVLDKSFYVIIPFSTLELGVSQTLKNTLIGTKSKMPYPKAYILQRAKTNLIPKRDHIVKQFHRLGLKIRQLSTKELIELFYNIYNPEGKGQVLTSSNDYSSPILEPNIKASIKKEGVKQKKETAQIQSQKQTETVQENKTQPEQQTTKAN